MGRHGRGPRHDKSNESQVQGPTRTSKATSREERHTDEHAGTGPRAAEFSRKAHVHPRHRQAAAPAPHRGSSRSGAQHAPKGAAQHVPELADRYPEAADFASPAPGSDVRRGCDHVFFIGFLGAGKTTVARNLGNMFHRSFVDVDRMVERELHASVTKIFATRGEEGFREAETEALRSLANRRSLLVSCGGGIIERPENARIMHELGKVVYLDGTLEDSLRQIRRPDKRPDLGDREHARALYAHRRPLYEQACDYRVCISGKTFEEVAYEVGGLLWERGLL